MKTKIQIMAVCLLSLVIVISCSKYDDDLVIDETMSQKLAQDNPEMQLMSTSSVTYGVTPSLGIFTPNSSSSVTLPGTSGCGSFYGGMIKAKVVVQSGSTFTVEIYPQVGTTFGGSGTAYVKATSVCGTVAGSTTYTSVNTKATVIINATFAQGVTHFYPVIITSTGGRYYAEPFMVYTLPTYASSPYWDGKLLATVDGVNLYASDTDLQSPSSYYQCTEFCNRYYSQVYNMNIINTGTQGGHARTWFANASAKGLNAFSNGGSTPPRVGDILCLSGGPIPPGQTQGYGHVGIITEVSSSQIKMANQNGGPNTFYPIGWTLSRVGNTISSPSSYTVQGWLRKP